MRSMTPAGVGGIPLPHCSKIPTSKMANEPTDGPKQAGIQFTDAATDVNKQLLARIGSESLLRTPSIKGSIYFYLDTPGDGNPAKEELINDPSALAAAHETLGIEIRHENKHHRWEAQLPHALKILEFAAIYLRRHNDASPGTMGVNAELKWIDEQGLDNIIHLTQGKGCVAWQVTRYA